MKSNTNELRKQLKTLLSASCSKTYYGIAPAPLIYPYVVYELREVQTESGCTQYVFEVNCTSRNVAEVEQLADTIQDSFDNYTYQNNKISFVTYRNQRQAVPEEDKAIKRIRLSFELDFYSKEE